MMRKMWLATRQFARWVKVHSPGSGYDNLGYSERLDYLNGGVGMRGSLASHGERTLVWNRVTAEEAREIADFADGMYGNGPYYLIDPVSATQNVLDKQWATPALTGKDGVPLIGLERPELVRNYDTSRGYPIEMARYDYADIGGSRTAYIPIPPGHVAWVGVHGDRESTGGLDVQPTSGEFQYGPSTTVPVTDVNAPLFSHSFPATADQAGIELTFRHGGPIVNHATTPSFEESDGTVTLYENLFTNPSFEAGSGTVEVRRNLNPTPDWSQAFTGWATSNMTDEGAVPGGRTFSGTHTLPNINRLSGSSLTMPSDQFMQGWKVKVADTSAPVTFVNRMVAGSTDIRKTGVTVQPGDEAYIAHIFDPVAGQASFRPVLEISNPGGAAFEFTVLDGVTVESTAIIRPAFSPGIPTPDPDLTPSWTGTPNASESILTAAAIPGTGGDAVRYRSSHWAASGSNSMRVQRPSATDVYVTVPTPGVALGKTYTIMFTTRVAEPIALAGIVSLQHQSGAWPYIPLLPTGTVLSGVQEHRFTVTVPAGGQWTNANSIRLVLRPDSAVNGSGIWYDSLALVEGEYTGPWFDGAHPINDPDFLTAWSGAPDASTTVVTAVKAKLPAGAAAYNCIPVRSTRGARSGPFSLRLIATGLGAMILIPVPSALSGGARARVTAYLQEPLDSTAAYYPSLTDLSGAVVDAVPNTSGFHDLQIEIPAETSSVLLTGAPGAEMGDVWYDSLGLFEPGYTGPYFDGDTFGAAWDGTPHESSSTLTTRRVTIAGIIVQIHPAGVTPPDGKFISGQGISGFQFEGKPQITPYSLAHDSFGLSAKIVEVESWL